MWYRVTSHSHRIINVETDAVLHPRAALCQVYDSIFRTLVLESLPWIPELTNLCTEDLPMSRVKFNVNTEYAYLQNFKILQSTSYR